MKVWVYEAGRANMKVFASEESARAWFSANDPEGVAFVYDVITATASDPPQNNPVVPE